METLKENIGNNIDIIKSKTGNSPDIIYKEYEIFNVKISIIYNETLTDKAFIDKFVLLYLSSLKKDTSKKPVFEYLEKNIPTHKTTRIKTFGELYYNLFGGFTIILVDGKEEALSLETRVKLDSGVSEAQNEQVIKGPKDAFTENYQTNIGLIRRRIKTESLWLEETVTGKKSKTKVGIMYVEDVVNKKLVNEVVKKIKNIDIDGVFDSNYILEMISENKKSTFANYISTERPDMVCMYLLEGRIAIIVENTQYVVIIPAVFVDFFHSTEDFYQKVINVNLIRIIRLIAFLTAILIPALYIAIVTYNIEIIPDSLLMSIVIQREGVPLPTILETLMMIIIFEILRETDTRLPSVIGSSLSIVGAIVLGQAAVAAGIVSPITIIVISVTAISGMISGNMDMVSGIRLWRIVFLIFAGFFGIFGVVLCSLIFIIYVTSMKSFGIPFFLPLAPFYLSEQQNTLILTNKRKFEERSFFTADKNKKKAG